MTSSGSPVMRRTRSPSTSTRIPQWASHSVQTLVTVLGMTVGPIVLRWRSGRERELARAGAEAELDQRVLPGRADDGLAVDPLQRELAPPVAEHEVGERPERGHDPRVVVL